MALNKMLASPTPSSPDGNWVYSLFTIDENLNEHSFDRLYLTHPTKEDLEWAEQEFLSNINKE